MRYPAARARSSSVRGNALRARLGEGFYAAIGCNGRGIAMATATGGLLAALISGAHERDCPVPVRRVRRFVGYRFRRPGVAAAVQLSRMLDNIPRML